MPNSTNANANSTSAAERSSFPRNIYSFSSQKAKRDLQRHKEHREGSSSLSHPPISHQIELFEQQNLFGPDFDAIEELTLNAERYKAHGNERQQLSVYDIPSVVSYNLDRIQHRLNSTLKLSLHPIISCCISFGISQLYKNPHVRDLADFRDRFLEDHIVNSGRDVLEFYALLKVFKIAIPDDSGGLKSEKMNILLPEWLAQNLGGLAKKLGAPVSSLLIICTMLTLSVQPTTIEAHQRQLSQAIDTFLRRVEMRKRIAEVLLETLNGDAQ